MADPNEIQLLKRDAAVLSWIQQFAPYGVITLDRSFQVWGWNHWMEIHSAKRLEEVAGKDLFALFPDLRQRNLVVPFERALSGESSVLSTALHHYLLPLASTMRESGFAQMQQTTRVMPLLSEGAVCGVLVIIEDVTQRESQSKALAKQHGRDGLLSGALAQLLKTEEPRKSIRQLFFKVAEYLDFDTVALYLRDMDSGFLGLYAVGGVPADSESDFAGYPFLVSLAESREISVFNSLQARPQPEYAVLKRMGVRAAVAIPLFANDRALGLLLFATCSRECIAVEESDLLTTIGQYFATAVDRENSRQALQKAKEQLSDYSKMLEVKVEERTARLQEIIAELETFSYTFAHDLKAPTRALTGYSQVLLDDFGDKLPAGAAVIVKRILHTSRRMEALFNDLLVFSKISRQDVVLARVEIEPIIEDLLNLRDPLAHQAVMVCAPLLAVRAHKGLLHQVLSNLVDNALKFVEPQTEPKIVIRTMLASGTSESAHAKLLIFSSTPSQELASRSAPRDQVRIWVEDNGIGIPAALHQKIFGIFERGTTSNLYEGTGMGLAIVAHAIQRMGGSYGVESEAGKGSRFWIELPAAPA